MGGVQRVVEGGCPPEISKDFSELVLSRDINNRVKVMYHPDEWQVKSKVMMIRVENAHQAYVQDILVGLICSATRTSLDRSHSSWSLSTQHRPLLGES